MDYQVYLFAVVPVMVIMCIVFACIIVGDVKTILRSMREGKHETIKNAARNYGQAAVFIGTACLYLGTPQQCEELCDDLWHRGQQAEVQQLTGEETQFNVL